MSSKFLNSTLYMYVLIIKVQFGFYIAYSTFLFRGGGGGGVTAFYKFGCLLYQRGLNRMFMVLKQWFFPAVLSLEMIILINNFLFIW